MTPWWGEVVAYAILVAVLVGYLAIREHRFRRAQRRENAATLAWIETQAELDAAKAAGRDVIDAAALPLSKSPAAVRIRNQIADNEVARFRRELDEWGA